MAKIDNTLKTAGKNDPAKGFNKTKLILAVCLLVVYFIAGKLGLSFAYVNASSSPVWPPTGLAIAALLIL